MCGPHRDGCESVVCTIVVTEKLECLVRRNIVSRRGPTCGSIDPFAGQYSVSIGIGERSGEISLSRTAPYGRALIPLGDRHRSAGIDTVQHGAKAWDSK